MLDLHAATWTGQKSYEIHATAKRYEMFESSIASRIGLGVAVDYAMALGLNEIYSRIRFLANRLRESLNRIDGVIVRDKGEKQCGIVTFTIEGTDPEAFQLAMRKQNINVGVSKRACALIDMDNWGVESIIRSPVHYFNTEQEVDLFVKHVERAAAASG